MEIEKIYIVFSTNDCDDPYYPQYERVIAIYKSKDKAIEAARLARKKTKKYSGPNDCYYVKEYKINDYNISQNYSSSESSYDASDDVDDDNDTDKDVDNNKDSDINSKENSKKWREELKKYWYYGEDEEKYYDENDSSFKMNKIVFMITRKQK